MKTTTHTSPSGTYDLRSDAPEYCHIDPEKGHDGNDGSFERPVATRAEAARRLPRGYEIIVNSKPVRIIPASIPPLTREMPYDISDLVRAAVKEGSSWREVVSIETNEVILLVEFVPGHLVRPLLEALKPYPEGKHVCFTPRDWADVPAEFRPSYITRRMQRDARNAYIKDSLDFAGGDRFRDLLSDGLTLLSMTYQQLADELKIIPATITHWAHGDASPAIGMQTLVISTLRKLMVDAVNSYLEKCARCGGSGVEPFSPPAQDGYRSGHDGACGDCDGYGTIITDYAMYWNDCDKKGIPWAR